MISEAHHAHDRAESLKISKLCGVKWVFFEERNDAVRQIIETPDAEAPDILPVIVVPCVTHDVTAAEEPLQRVENLHALLSLYYRERRLNLPTDTTR